MGNGDTNDISFNVTELQIIDIINIIIQLQILCKTDASGLDFQKQDVILY